MAEEFDCYVDPDDLACGCDLWTFVEYGRIVLFAGEDDHDTDLFPHSRFEHGLQRRRTPIRL